MSGPEILMILVAVFAVGRHVARWRNSRSGRGSRWASFRNLLAVGLVALSGIYVVAGLVFAVRCGFTLLAYPHGVGPGLPVLAILIGIGSVACLLFACFFLWLAFRIGPGGGLLERLARAARAACREFVASADAGAKPKPDPASRLLD